MENTEPNEAIWGLQDYAIWVPMADNFYKSLPFYKITLEQFRSGQYVGQPAYKDSRTYIIPALQYFDELDILDVGGYVGRFTIEACLAAKELDLSPNITCFEPGVTREMIERNLQLNGFEERATVLPYAASSKRGTNTFAIPNHARITSRLIPSSQANDKQYDEGWNIVEVESDMLSSYLKPGRPFICKIDTEGHEVSVIEGIGQQILGTAPHLMIIEFWPQVLNQKIFGTTFKEFALENYHVYNIESSLYPRRYDLLSDFDKVVELITSQEVNNLDIMLVSKNFSGHEEFVAKILAAA